MTSRQTVPSTLLRTRRLRRVAILAALAVLVTACGQLSGVREGTLVAERQQDRQGDGGGVAAPDGDAEPRAATDARDIEQSGGEREVSVAEPGDDPTDSAGSRRERGSSGGTESQPPAEPSGSQQSESEGAAPDTGAAQAEGSPNLQGSDRTGVTDDTLFLGSHAPVTGAAPLPSRSFEESADSYWAWLREEHGERLLGRDVEGIFRDDRYQPSTAVQVCRELAEEVFQFGGAGGTDQIQACGQFAERAQAPYISAGVTEAGLEGLDWYFALTMTYRAQGGILAEMVADEFPRQKVAAVVTDTPNFDDAVSGWEAGVERENLDYFRTFRHPRGDTAWYNTIARELSQNGVDVVYMLTSPVDYIRFAQQASQQGYDPQYVGVGISMGLNDVLGAGCPEVDGGIFFSPFPGLDFARDNVPEFFETQQRLEAPEDDLSFAIWGQSAAVHDIYSGYEAHYGTRDLTREDFRRYLEQRDSIETGIFPRASFSPDDHFGGTGVHVLQADCSIEEHRTLHTFVSSFR